MSRSKLIRALLAAASLLGALPLLAQTPASSADAAQGTAFPYGRFTPQPGPGAPAGPEALVIAFSEGTIQIYQGGTLVETDGMSVTGPRWQIWELTGGCAEPDPLVGSYIWSFDGTVLRFDVADDPCPGRSEKVSAIRLVRVP